MGSDRKQTIYKHYVCTLSLIKTNFPVFEHYSTCRLKLKNIKAFIRLLSFMSSTTKRPKLRNVSHHLFHKLSKQKKERKRFLLLSDCCCLKIKLTEQTKLAKNNLNILAKNPKHVWHPFVRLIEHWA